PATRYTVTVGTELTALDGSYLAKPVKRTFETWRPKVRHIRFNAWLGPRLPNLVVTTNEPVTAQALAKQLRFYRSDSDGDGLPVYVLPYDKKRSGPIWLPVPDHPGAVVMIDNPQPDQPLGAGKSAGA